MGGEQRAVRVPPTANRGTTAFMHVLRFWCCPCHEAFPWTLGHHCNCFPGFECTHTGGGRWAVGWAFGPTHPPGRRQLHCPLQASPNHACCSQTFLYYQGWLLPGLMS